MPLRQIVVNPDLVAGRNQQAGRMAADVAGPAGYQNPHEKFLAVSRNRRPPEDFRINYDGRNGSKILRLFARTA